MYNDYKTFDVIEIEKYERTASTHMDGITCDMEVVVLMMIEEWAKFVDRYTKHREKKLKFNVVFVGQNTNAKIGDVRIERLQHVTHKIYGGAVRAVVSGFSYDLFRAHLPRDVEMWP